MRLDLAAVRTSLAADGLDGWLLYDFQGSNPIAVRLAGLNRDQKLATRRWFYFIPAAGEPRGLVHAIEPGSLDQLPGQKFRYAERRELEQGIAKLIGGSRRIAMEYSPGCAIPYVSRVDAGTVDLIRERGAEVVSSGDLVQRFEAVWDPAALASHRAAAERLYRIKDRAFEAVGRRIGEGTPTSELEIQQLMVEWFREEQLVSDSTPVVAAQENSGNPHYLPTETKHRPIGPDELVLLDLWGKKGEPGAVFADITWVGYTGRRVPHRYQEAFTAVRNARDAAVAVVRTAVAEGRDLRGWEVDRAARRVIEDAGFGRYFVHRTGHSLGEVVHGNGVHMDDYETHDDRRLLPGTGFTIEPGVYFDAFGIRSEVNVYVGEREATVTGPVQQAIVALLA